MDDEGDWVDHRSTPLTVAELRSAIAGLPDGMLIMAVCPEDAEHSRHTIINVVGAEVRGTLYDELATPRLLLEASWPSGRYRR